MRSMRSLAISLAMLTSITLAPAASAQESIAEYAGVGHTLFCEQDIAELDKAAKLSPAQKEATEALMRSAATQARTIYGRLMRACTEKSEALQAKASDPEAYQVAHKEYMSEYMRLADAANKEIAAVEREALTDIRNALKPEQIEKGWPAFERARRRLMLVNGQWMGLGRNPRAALMAIKPSPADAAAAEEILARYELELDPLLVQRMQALHRMYTELREKSDYDMSMWQTMWQRPDLLGPKVNKLNVKTAQAIEKALSDEGRKLFLRQRVGVELQHWQGGFQRPAADERVKQIVRLSSLSDAQRDQVKALITKADDAMFELALAALRESDEAALREEAASAEDTQAKATQRHQKAQTQIAVLIKDLRAVLKPEQVEDIDFAFAQQPGSDLFKTDRSPQETSAWNTDPMKDPPTGSPQP